MAKLQRIAPCLWFAGDAEEAAKFYVGIFPNSRIRATTRYGKAGQEFHQRPEGSVMTIEFELDGQSFTGLNGPPLFKFSEAISFQVTCETQEEVDRYWEKLGEGGDPEAQQCGWLKDKYGLSWQIVPAGMEEFFQGGPNAGTERAMSAMMQMKKLDLAALQKARRSVAQAAAGQADHGTAGAEVCQWSTVFDRRGVWSTDTGTSVPRFPREKRGDCVIASIGTTGLVDTLSLGWMD